MRIEGEEEKMDIHVLASNILQCVGGAENVRELTHCFTRLRFVLRDNGKADAEAANRLEGVIQVVVSGGQFQVVLGSKVEAVYEEMVPMIRQSDADGTEGQKGTANRFHQGIQLISNMFTPLIPAIAASGLLKGLLTAARLLAARWGTDISGQDTYVLLYAASQVIFYFMPVFLGYTAAKAVKCNEIIAMTIGGFLCYPQVDAIIQDVSTATAIFGLPVMKGEWTIGQSTRVFGYTESVIPIILAVLALMVLERLLKKGIPQILQLILVPGISLIVMVPLTLCLLGPIGIWAGNGIQWVYDALMRLNAVLGGAVVGGLWCVFVIFGAHRALLPVGLNDVAISGKQNLLAFAGAANFAQGGAALGVMLKTKNKDLRSVAASSVLSAALVGITEPAIYSCNLRLKKPMVCAIVCGAAGGALMGAGGVYGDAFANNGVLTIFTYAAFGTAPFVMYLLGIAIAFFGTALLTPLAEDLLVDERKEDIPPASPIQEEKMEEEPPCEDGENKSDSMREIFLEAPVEGDVFSIRFVKDPVFASEALGKGIAVLPKKGEVFAPADGTVSVIYPTLHALGMKLDCGVELLIHIGVNTVHLNGKYFEKHIEAGTHLTKGTKIISFDVEKMKAEGYGTEVMIIVGNTDAFEEVEAVEQRGDGLPRGGIRITRKEETAEDRGE